MNIPRTLLAGVGSPHGDDQAGWLIAERLAADVDQREVAVRRVKSPLQLLDWLAGVERLILCDACRGLGRVGELRRWVWPAPELVDVSWSGTHDVTLTTALELADRLNRLPRAVVIWSVEATQGQPLAALSPAVATALPRLIAEVAHELQPIAEINSGFRELNPG